jgi:hypothetical protein
MSRVKSLVWLFLLSAFAAFAQYRAALQGVVRDPSGAVVPDTKLTLTSTETNIARTTTSNGSGAYTFPGLAPGNYVLTAEAAGFDKAILDNVRITSEQTQAQDVQLNVAQQAAQVVTVNASDTSEVNTENGTISSTFSGQQIQSLPTFSRDPFQAASLAAGSFGDNARSSNGSSAHNLPGNAGPGATSGTSSIFQTENQVQVSANGNRTENNSFQIDGVEVNSLAWGGAAVITPNEESIKEVTVSANPYSAENGRNSGAQVLVVSKNGTNDFHGSAMMKMDRPGLNAYQRWNGPNNPVQKDTDRFNQFAGSLGGPVLKNHLFFFFSYETLRNESVSTGTGWYETPQFISAVQAAAPGSIAAKILGYPGEGASFSQIIPKSCSDAGISNPALCQPVFNGGQYVGLDVGSPLKTPLGTTDPGYVSNGNFGVGGGLDGIPDVMFVQTANPFSSNPQQFNGRMDYQATGRDLIAFSTYVVPVSTTSYNGPVRAANLWHNNRTNEAAALLWDHTFGASWLNEARFNVTRWLWNEVSDNPQEPFGLPQDTVDNFGSVNLQYIGAPGPSIFNQTTYNFRDTASTQIGRHSLKIGVDLYKEQDNDNLSYAARPSYNFRNVWDLANDAPYQEVGNFDPKTGFPTSATKYIRSSIYALFVQDDFRVTPSLTLNLGLRWEYFTPVHEKYDNISNVLLGTGVDPLSGLRLKVGGSLYQPDYKNFGPQVGFAWRPNASSDKVVVRGGFGIGYNRMEEAITLNGRANPPLVTSFTLTGANVLYAVPSNPKQFGGFPSNPAAVQTFDPATGLPVGGAPVTLNGFPQDLPTPRTYRYSLQTDYNFATSWTASLGYQGNQTRHQTVQNNLNFLYPVNPGVGYLYWYYNGANASYNAFLAELTHRFAHSFQADLQYRWSKTIDEGSNSYYIDPYPYSVTYARGPADFDAEHNIKLYGVWSPNLFKGGWKEKVFGNWQFSGIMNWHTGFPWTPLYSNTGCNVVYPNSGYCNLRPQGYLGGAGTDYSNSTFERPNGNFPNGSLAYFTVPTVPPTGIPVPPDVGRNILRGPQFFSVDMTGQKSFGLPKIPVFGENARLTIRADLFNIFNKLNLDPSQVNNTISYNGTDSNPLFGQAQAALSGRIVEFQARFEF